MNVKVKFTGKVPFVSEGQRYEPGMEYTVPEATANKFTAFFEKLNTKVVKEEVKEVIEPKPKPRRNVKSKED